MNVCLCVCEAWSPSADWLTVTQRHVLRRTPISALLILLAPLCVRDRGRAPFVALSRVTNRRSAMKKKTENKVLVLIMSRNSILINN